VLTGFADRLVCPASATWWGCPSAHRQGNGGLSLWVNTENQTRDGEGEGGGGAESDGVVSQDRYYFFYPSSFILKYAIVDICATSEARCRQPNDIIPGDYKLPSFEKTTTTTACKCM